MDLLLSNMEDTKLLNALEQLLLNEFDVTCDAETSNVPYFFIQKEWPLGHEAYYRGKGSLRAAIRDAMKYEADDNLRD